MNLKLFFPITFLLFLTLSCSKDKTALNDLYQFASDWPSESVYESIGKPVGIDVDNEQNIVVFHRAGRAWDGEFPDDYIASNTIAHIDNETGEIIRSWGANLFIMPHGLTVDNDNNIWVTDVGRHQVLKFSQTGDLLMTLGEEKMAGNDDNHFDQPTDVAIAETDGSIYVSDGYGNSRIVKFDAAGNFVTAWGEQGEATGQFNLPHGIDVGQNETIYVADRENSRVQAFNSTGSFLEDWSDASLEKVYSVLLDDLSNRLLFTDYKRTFTGAKGSNLVVVDLLDNKLSKIGCAGNYDGPKTRYHDIAVDSSGAVYMVDLLDDKIHKFIKR